MLKLRNRKKPMANCFVVLGTCGFLIGCADQNGTNARGTRFGAGTVTGSPVSGAAGGSSLAGMGSVGRH